MLDTTLCTVTRVVSGVGQVKRFLLNVLQCSTCYKLAISNTCLRFIVRIRPKHPRFLRVKEGMAI